MASLSTFTMTTFPPTPTTDRRTTVAGFGGDRATFPQPPKIVSRRSDTSNYYLEVETLSAAATAFPFPLSGGTFGSTGSRNLLLPPGFGKEAETTVDPTNGNNDNYSFLPILGNKAAEAVDPTNGNGDNFFNPFLYFLFGKKAETTVDPTNGNNDNYFFLPILCNKAAETVDPTNGNGDNFLNPFSYFLFGKKG
ncbi:unnamed protein product [Linum trigynum]|uniref:Uncharacterized protein n=1 Tax=Linum trigynum TaxID=586398 RepID=A0AAV2FK57_9ROSI